MVGDGQRFPCVLLDQDDGEPVLPAEPGHQVHDLRHDPRRQAERRLIEQQRPRPREQGAGDHQHLPLTAGQRGGQLAATVGQRLEAPVGLIQRGGPIRTPAPCRLLAPGHLLARGRTPPAQPAGPGHHPDPQVLLHGELGDHALPLGHVRDAGPDHLLRAAAGHIGAAEQDPASAGFDHAADRAQQRRLACAVGAEHGRNGTGSRRHGDVVQRGDPGVARDEPFDLQRGGPVG